VEFRGSAGEGTEVRMEFRVACRIDETVRAAGLAPADGGSAPGGEVVLSVGPRAILPNVLGRLAGALAVRAHFSIDRLSDLQLLTDALAAHAPRGGEQLTVALDAAPRRLELSLGPLPIGQAEELVRDSALGGPEPLIAKLADELRTERLDHTELLHLAISDTRL